MRSSTVSAIVASPGRAGRFDVLVDGRSVGIVPVEVLERLGLREGVEFEPLRAAFEGEVTLLGTSDRAVEMLARRAWSRVALTRELKRKGEDAAQVAVVIERLERAGYLDDADYARQFARSRVARSGTSRRRLEQELARRGVAREVAGAAVAEVFSEEGLDERSTLERVARRKLATSGDLDDRASWARLYRFLARRGYGSDDVRSVMARLRGERAAGGECSPDEQAR